jgi:hypothetical protein
MINTTMAMAATPPTTPPTIALIGTGFGPGGGEVVGVELVFVEVLGNRLVEGLCDGLVVGDVEVAVVGLMVSYQTALENEIEGTVVLEAVM